MLCRGSRKMAETGRPVPAARLLPFIRSANLHRADAALCPGWGVKRSMSQAAALKEPSSERELQEAKWYQ